MKLKNRFVIILLIALGAVAAGIIGFFLMKWTGVIQSQYRIAELRTALKEVLDKYGEKGLLEMAGVPVDNIYYGDSGVCLDLQRRRAAEHQHLRELQQGRGAH